MAGNKKHKTPNKAATVNQRVSIACITAVQYIDCFLGKIHIIKSICCQENAMMDNVTNNANLKKIWYLFL